MVCGLTLALRGAPQLNNMFGIPRPVRLIAENIITRYICSNLKSDKCRGDQQPCLLDTVQQHVTNFFLKLIHDADLRSGLQYSVVPYSGIAVFV